MPTARHDLHVSRLAAIWLQNIRDSVIITTTPIRKQVRRRSGARSPAWTAHDTETRITQPTPANPNCPTADSSYPTDMSETTVPRSSRAPPHSNPDHRPSRDRFGRRREATPRISTSDRGGCRRSRDHGPDAGGVLSSAVSPPNLRWWEADMRSIPHRRARDGQQPAVAQAGSHRHGPGSGGGVRAARAGDAGPALAVSAATNKVARSQTKLNRSPNRLCGSARAQRCSLRW